MEFTTAQIELLATDVESSYTKFTNSELFGKDAIKHIHDEIISHGHIFDILLDRGTNNYTRPIEAFSPEEALSLKMLLNNNFDSASILRNALQYKFIRVFFADVPDKDSYYYLINFKHDKEFYISVILLKDFPADESSNIQYSLIRDIIQLYFAISCKNLGIPINYSEDNEEVICFPYTLRSSDFIFIANYFAYYLDALATFIPESAIENTITENGLSLLIGSEEDGLNVFRDRHKVIDGNASDLVDYAYMITTSYFTSVVQIARITSEDMAKANESVIAASEEESDV